MFEKFTHQTLKQHGQLDIVQHHSHIS